MALTHVVTFTFRPNTTLESIAALSAALDELASEGLALSYHHGPDLNARPDNADYAVAAVFDDEAAFLAYITSAKHLRITNELLAPYLESRSAVQFSTGT